MRPKKKILLVSEDQHRLSYFRFLLMVHAYNVFAAESLTTANNIALLERPDAAIILLPFKGTGALLDELRRKEFARPIAVLAEDGKSQATFLADAHLAADTSPAEFLERLKIWTARKRGPRKGSKRAIEPAIEEVCA